MAPVDGMRLGGLLLLVLPHHARASCADYVGRNDLRDLSPPQFCYQTAQALCVQSFTTSNDNTGRRMLCVWNAATSACETGPMEACDTCADMQGRTNARDSGTGCAGVAISATRLSCEAHYDMQPASIRLCHWQGTTCVAGQWHNRMLAGCMS